MSFLTLFTADAAAAHGHEFSPTFLTNRYWNDTSPDPMRRIPRLTPSVSTVPEDILPTPSPPPPPPRPPQTPIQKQPLRTKTSYYLAQPPPGSHSSRHCSRAERALIVQLQRVSNTSRPLPTLDVLPSFVFGSKLKRVGQRLQGAGQQDIVFVTSEQYVRQDGDDGGGDSSDEDDLSSRRVIASVSQGYRRNSGEEGKGIRTTMIQFDDGLIWEASPLASGGYEFVAHEPNGTMRVAKWLPRSPNMRRGSRLTLDSGERKFQFSILDTVTRRKPILAWMGKQSIDILDRHPGSRDTVNSANNTPVNTPPASIVDVEMSSEDGSIHAQHSEISEHLKGFIIVTGTWVALREGFTSMNSRLEEGTTISSPSTPTAPTFRPRSMSATFNMGGTTVTEEIARRRIHRQGTMLAHQATTKSDAVLEPAEVPQRARSVGSAPHDVPRTAAPKTPEQRRQTVRLLAPGAGSVRPISLPPPLASPTRAHGCVSTRTQQLVSRSFSGRNNRHSTPVPLTAELSMAYDGNGTMSTRSQSPIDFGKGREKRGRFGLRAFVSNIFKRSSSTV